jgi:polar amino acid transport system substrate-binding protein
VQQGDTASGGVSMTTIRAIRAAILGIAAIGFATAAQADALDDIMKAKLIKVAVPQDFAPFGSAGPDLKPQGYDIDMANLIGEALGVKVEIVPVTSANRIPYLQTKRADIIISSLGKNPEREKVIDFTIAYAPFYSGVFGAKDIAVSKVDELAGKTVGATRGAIEEQELSKMAPASATIKRYEDNNATIAAFISGQVDLIATGNVVAASIAEKNPARAGEQIRDQEQPLLCRPQQRRAETAREAERDHRQGEEFGRARKNLGEVAEGAAASGPVTRPATGPRGGPRANPRQKNCK